MTTTVYAAILHIVAVLATAALLGVAMIQDHPDPAIITPLVGLLTGLVGGGMAVGLAYMTPPGTSAAPAAPTGPAPSPPGPGLSAMPRATGQTPLPISPAA